jgi:chitinase
MLARNFLRVGYLPSWSGSVSDIPFDKLTHVNYAFLLPEDSGTGGLQRIENPEKLSRLVSAAHAPGVGVKALISVGGWNGGNDQGFERLAADAAATATFVDEIVRFVSAYRLDGVDIDWEYPDPGNSARHYADLMKRLGEALRRRGKLLTAAVVAMGKTGEGVPREVFDQVDYLTLMAYDGGGGPAHSPYGYARESLDYWLGRGLPRSKAVLGLPFYERPTWNAYSALVAADPRAPEKDSIVYHGKTVYYNGIATIKQKTELALMRGGGVMIWELSQDTRDDTSLLRAIDETVRKA